MEEKGRKGLTRRRNEGTDQTMRRSEEKARLGGEVKRSEEKARLGG